MKKAIICGLAALAIGGTTAAAQRFAIKGYDNITLGKAFSITNAQPGQTSKSSSNSFGIDFGYRFWERGHQFLEANIGVGYSFASATFRLADMEYHYAAPAYADEDGNPYERYYRIRNLKQRTSLGYFNVPISIDYEYRALSWLGIYAEVGVGLSFRCKSSVGGVSGMAYSYGIYPEYDDLLIDADYLNDFGDRNLMHAKKNELKTKAFAASVMCGAGFEFYTYEPVSFVVGVRYNVGLTQVFNGGYDITSIGEYTQETAPVIYTVADGQTVRPLADYTTKSRMMPLSLHVGVNVRF